MFMKSQSSALGKQKNFTHFLGKKLYVSSKSSPIQPLDKVILNDNVTPEEPKTKYPTNPNQSINVLRTKNKPNDGFNNFV